MSRRTGLPRYVHIDRQRDGRQRLLYRPPGGPCITLPGPAGSDAFWTAYAAARGAAQTPAAGSARPKQGELGAAAEGWFRSAQFRALDPLTQADKRGVIGSILAEPLLADAPDGLAFLTCPLASLTTRHVAVLRDRKAGAPAAANKRLRYLRQLLDWCVETGAIRANPAAAVKRVRAPKGGHHTWALAEVEAYLTRHPPGTMARLAVMILLFAGLRRSDAVTLGRQHIRDGWIRKPQVKNRGRWPKTIEIPVLPPLAEEIERTARPGALALLTTEAGAPFTAKGFGERMKKWTRAAGIPAACTAHGLRKVGATLAADNGASNAQLKAVFGWEGDAEAALYTAARDRRRLAADGIQKIALPGGPEIHTQGSASVKTRRKSQ